MTSKVAPLPFAFLLALATEANGNAIAPQFDANGALQPGMLSDLLKYDGAPEFTIKSIERMTDNKTTTVVQYFPNFPNFRNCFMGNWRNC